MPALVRVPARTPEYISRVLDGGALGVIAPGIRSAAEAKNVVAAAKYPPLGSRGLSAGLAHLGFRSVPAAEALPALNEATMVIVQLESAAGLAAVDDIVAVEGIDMVLIGTTTSRRPRPPGEYDHSRLREMYTRHRPRAARATSKSASAPGSRPVWCSST